jgi:hypothetical protein
MKSILTTLLLAAATGLSFAGPATTSGKSPKAPVIAPPECASLQYDYAEFGYLHYDGGNFGGTSDGGYLDVNKQLFGNVLGDATVGVLGGDTDITQVGAGLGYFHAVTEKFHLIARGGWAYGDTDLGAGEHEAYLSPGFRWQIACKLELYAKAYYHMPETSDNNWSGGAGLVYTMCPRSAFVVGGAIGEDDQWSAQAGVRYKF